MNLPEITALIMAGVALLGVFLPYLRQSKADSRQATKIKAEAEKLEVEAGATQVETSLALVAELKEQLDRALAENKGLKQRLDNMQLEIDTGFAAIRAEFEAELEAERQKNLELTERVSCLEKENKQLRDKIASGRGFT